MKKTIVHKKGFTIFFAVLVSSLALSVGLAIYDVVSRELLLSQTTAQSQNAIFVADTGAECALYWDQQFRRVNPTDFDGSAFSTSSETLPSEIAAAGQAFCAGYDITNNTVLSLPWVVTLTPTSAVTVFQVSSTTSAGPCATVRVEKTGNPPQTTVTSRGYNTCAASGVTRVERALQLTY